MTDLHKKTVSRLRARDDYGSNLAKTNLFEMLDLAERASFGVNLFSERLFRYNVMQFMFFDAIKDRGLHLVCRYDNITRYYLGCNAFDKYVILIDDERVWLDRPNDYIDALSVSKDPRIDELKYQMVATLGDQEINLESYAMTRVILANHRSRSRLRHLDPLLYNEAMVLFIALSKYASSDMQDDDFFCLMDVMRNETYFNIYAYRNHVLFDISERFYLEFTGDFFRLLTKMDVRSEVSTDFVVERSMFFEALRNSIRKEFLDTHDTFLL